jgi:hypothetical protein
MEYTGFVKDKSCLPADWFFDRQPLLSAGSAPCQRNSLVLYLRHINQ